MRGGGGVYSPISEFQVESNATQPTSYILFFCSLITNNNQPNYAMRFDQNLS